MKPKIFVFVISVLALLHVISFSQMQASAQISPGDFIVAEHNYYDSIGKIVQITPNGVRTEIFNFAAGTVCRGVAVDSNGDFIVTETDKLSRVTPTGERTEIFSFTPGTNPHQVAIEGNGDFIVAEHGPDKITRITRNGLRMEVFSYSQDTNPIGVAVDGNGDFIVTESIPGKLARITPSGQRTEIFTFPEGTWAWPHMIAIDNNGDFIVTTAFSDKLYRVTPSGVGTELFTFPSGTYPVGVAVDSNGDFIVTGGIGPDGIGLGGYTDKLIRITPYGVDTIIFSFTAGTNPAGVAVMPTLVKEVAIDIKPASYPNSINLSSAGVIPVAILGSVTFDATTVNPETISLMGASVKLVGKSAKYLCHEEDVNADGFLDLVCQVNTAEFMIEPGESVAELTAETYDGTPIRGEDTVQIVQD